MKFPGTGGQSFRPLQGYYFYISGLLFRGELRNSTFFFLEFALFGLAYLVVGWKVIILAVKNILNKQVFSE